MATSQTFLSIAGERSHTSPVSLSSTASSAGVPVPASKTAKRGLGGQSCQSASVMSHSGRTDGLRYISVDAKAHRGLYLVSWHAIRDFRKVFLDAPVWRRRKDGRRNAAILRQSFFLFFLRHR